MNISHKSMKTYFCKPALLFLLLLLPVVLEAQVVGQMIRGKITDNATNEALIGVSIAETDATNRVFGGAITNMDGEFALKITNPQNRLRITYMGYKGETVNIAGKTFFDIRLKEDSQVLSEVVIASTRQRNTGIMNIPTREITTAMQTFELKDIEGVQVTDIADALQGRIAGLDIVANSGAPGAGSAMKIRGTSTIIGNTEPLIVVNGVPFKTDIPSNFDFATANEEEFATLLSVNPDDIESITVLKDAASTAIYGADGSNGVLLITTKRGAIGKTRVSYTYRLSGAEQPKGLDMLNGDDYTMLMKQAYYNPTLNQSIAESIREFNYDQNFSEYENFNNNTDWVDAVTQRGWTHDHYLTVSGGGERATFRVSTGYYNQRGTTIGSALDRFSFRSILDYNVSDRMRFTSEISFTYADNEKNYVDDNNKSSILDIAYRKMPNVSIYAQDREGNDTDVYYNILQSSNLHSSQKDLMNPVALAKLATFDQKNYRILPTFRLSYYILDPEVTILKYEGYVSFDVNNTKDSKFLPKEVSSYLWDNQNINRAESRDGESLSVMTENKIQWQPKFENKSHTLTALGLVQTRSSNSETQRIVTYGLPNGQKIVDASAAGYLNTVSSSLGKGRSMGALLSAHYAYKSRYILNFSMRIDGSSRFGKDQRFGTFPGVSGKWIVSDESFWKPVSKVVNEFAIRPSWGITGRSPGSDYLAFSRYRSYDIGYLGYNGVYPVSLQLSNLKWEKAKEVNVGTDIHLFDSKLIFDLNYYNTRTEDLLHSSLTIPSSSGFGRLSYLNAGTVTKEGWEFYLTTKNLIKSKDFTMDFNFNMANAVNTVDAMPEEVLNALNSSFGGNNGEYLTRIQEGKPLGSIYGFRYKGVYQYSEYNEEYGHTNAPVARDENGKIIFDAKGEPKRMIYSGGNNHYQFQGGDAIYEDVNNDGAIDELDIVYLGSSNPKLNGGFGTNLKYKNFGLNLFFNFRYGQKIINRARMIAENMHTNDNQSAAVNWRWRKEGDETEMPRALYSYGYNWLGSDRFVEDGSFLRFKYLSFSYYAPTEWVKRNGLNQLSVYLTLNNIYCFTKYTGVDPEVGESGFGRQAIDNSKTPRPREFTMGLTIGF